jgi:hypothetical protein
MPAVEEVVRLEKRVGKEAAMDAHEAPARQVGGDNAITSRLGEVALLQGVIVLAIAEPVHPSREDPIDNVAVFREYAAGDSWTTVHLGEYLGFLLLLGGLVALYYSVSTRPGAGVALFGPAAAVTAAASFTVLQAVDGIALKRAVDAWESAPAEQESSAFAAAEAVRWIEMGMNRLSYFLAGLSLYLYGVVIALRSVYPRWAGLIAAVFGMALMYNGVVEVAYEGFVASTIKLVGLALWALWAFIMALLMWRNGSGRRIARLASPPTDPAQRPASPR